MTRCFQADNIDEAAVEIRAMMASAKSPVAFTGAGISTESGVPDFRSPGGVWSTNRMIDFSEYLSSEAARKEYWQQKASQCREFESARPNVTHDVLAHWEAESVLRGVITQNIDGLHQLAGSREVLELHGTARRVGCLECSWSDPVDAWNDQFVASGQVPRCPDCQGVIKHATVSFGQSLPGTVLQKAIDWARDADVFFALGSSLLVEPAASLPRIAADHGAQLVIVNRESTPLDHRAAVVVNAALGELFHLLQGPGP